MGSRRVNSILVFSQTKTKRVLVGKFWREKGKFFFEYDPAYQKLKQAIPLGPEFELWKSKFSSRKLFPSLADRIPSPQNPAYKDYCDQWGIDEKESDPFILLTTIGRRGPSTFIFEPNIESDYNGESIKSFRKELNLSQNEFEKLLNIPHATLVRLEMNQSENDILRTYIEVFDKVPQALEWILEKRKIYLHDQKILFLKGKIKKIK